MGLALSVGTLSELKLNNNEEDFILMKEEFEKLNSLLKKTGIPPHIEPVSLSEDDIFSCEMFGYGGLHHLRRYAACIALKKQEANPIEYNLSDDEFTDEYYSIATRKPPGFFGKIIGRTKPEILPYQHLILHSDSEGYYLPQEIDFEIHSPSKTDYMVGSAQKLYEECKHLATLLEIPVSLDHESDEVWSAAEDPPKNGIKWKRYGIETLTCLSLIRACEVALKHKAALIFC